MRISLKISSNTEPVSFEHQQKLVGVIHKWIGHNDLHGRLSLYSFSRLFGARLRVNSLDFPCGATMFISFWDESVARRVIGSITQDPSMFCGMQVKEINLCGTPDFSDRDLFYCGSPIFIKRNLDDGTIRQYNFSDEESGQLMKETLETKMRMAGLEDDTLEVKFDLSYGKKRLKLINYHNVGNKVNVCPVMIKGKPETKLFAWNVGIGNCTGIGFGAIY